MKLATDLWLFVIQQRDKLLEQTIQHIWLTLISLLLAVLIGLPAGVLISRRKSLAGPVLAIAGIFQTIPSIALLGFLIPLVGIGPRPAILALFFYGLLPIIRNTYTGIKGVDADIKEAAMGMGMNNWQLMYKIELPLAMPVILAGIRTATVVNVGVATLAAYIAAGGLGEFIFGGISLNNPAMILAGAIPAAMLALAFDFILSRLQHLRTLKIRSFVLLLSLMAIFSSFYFIPIGKGNGLLAGFTPEFMGRTDGWLGLQRVYGLHIKTVVINDALMYEAAFQKKLDVISGYSTDGRIRAFGLLKLRDDQGIFPPYYAAPLVQEQTLDRYPELEAVLDLLAGRINDSIMTALNHRADYLHENPETIARDFLRSQNLWKPFRAGGKGVIRIGSKIFDEQYILVSLYTQLIRGYTDLEVTVKSGLGGTKICFDALTHNEIDLYPEYTGTALLVILQPDAGTIQRMIKNKDAVYQYLQQAFHTKFGLRWLTPIGFNNTYALMMRKEESDRLNIKSISDLVYHINQQK